jgi:Skp family chaperone for outer membrane proteins
MRPLRARFLSSAVAATFLALLLGCGDRETPRVVVLDMEKIAAESTAAKAVLGEVERLSEAAQNQLSRLAREIQAAEEAGRTRPADLEAMKRHWIGLRQEAESQVGARREAAAGEMEQLLRRAVEELAPEKGWDLALRKEDGAVWFQRDLDVTADVSKRMDEIWNRTRSGSRP